MLNKKKLSLFLIFNLLVFSSCSSFKKNAGLEKDLPNDFLIEKRDSLVMPPEYKILPPDSIIKEKENRQSIANSNSLKATLDANLNKNKIKNKGKPNKNTKVEKDILNQIK